MASHISTSHQASNNKSAYAAGGVVLTSLVMSYLVLLLLWVQLQVSSCLLKDIGEVVWPYWLAIPLENKGRLLSLKSNDDLMRCPPPLGVVGHEGLGMQVLAQQAIACFT
ncbi:hypothetical protein TIFTF001_051149 [Ficus carica]|uniref:Uncharacterized protein n=1 Tax=Ficus carica TaxID=3494 RepID=A0AA87YSI1_FICCA|nr:hypothetical protein TIFTF001_051149 [Ficus carica]